MLCCCQSTPSKYVEHRPYVESVDRYPPVGGGVSVPSSAGSFELLGVALLPMFELLVLPLPVFGLLGSPKLC